MKETIQIRKQIHLFDLSTHKLLAAIVFISIFTMAVRVPADTDTWWHLRTGQYIVESQTLPLTDPFSHTKDGELWVNHSWLGQIFWYSLYVVGGWAALALALAGLVTIAFWFIWKQVEGNIFIAAVAMILGAIVSSVVWVARPQMITFVLAAVVAYLLDRFKRHNGSLLPWLPLMMLFWANIHGGFAIAFMLIAAYLVGETANHLTKHQEDPVASWARLKYLLIVTVVSLAVVVVNPHTWRMWLYPFQTVGIGALRDFIQEWRSPDFHLSHAQPFVLMLLLVIVALARSGRNADWTDLALVGMWTMWALFAARNIAIFGLVIAPILARYADLAWTRQWQQWGYSQVPFAAAPMRSSGYHSRNPKVMLNWVLLALVIVAALIKISLPLAAEANLKNERDSLPYRAVTFIQDEQPSGPIFNSYNWGGYLIFKLWPDYPVYIDGRTDLYDDAFIRRYLKAMTADEGWEQILREDGINLVLIETNSTLAKFLRRDLAWTELYRDDTTAIFSRIEALP